MSLPYREARCASRYQVIGHRDLLRQRKSTCCRSAQGCAWHSVSVESFFSTLKVDPDLELDETRKELSSLRSMQQLAFWIDGYDNNERRPSPIGYRSALDPSSCSLQPVHSIL